LLVTFPPYSRLPNPLARVSFFVYQPGVSFLGTLTFRLEPASTEDRCFCPRCLQCLLETKKSRQRKHYKCCVVQVNHHKSGNFMLCNACEINSINDQYHGPQSIQLLTSIVVYKQSSKHSKQNNSSVLITNCMCYFNFIVKYMKCKQTGIQSTTARRVTSRYCLG
jgi:hypothetical protein